MTDETVKAELQEDFYPRSAQNGTLVWGNYTADEMLDDEMAPAESVELFSLFFTYQGEGRFHVHPCGFAYPVAQFETDEYDDPYGLIADAYSWHILVYQEMSDEDRREVFKRLTSDVEKEHESGYIYVDDTALDFEPDDEEELEAQ